MIQIAICDDKKITTANLDELLKNYMAERLLDTNIVYFLSPSALYNYMSRNPVDIVFMDLDFGSEEEDGILWSTRIHQDFPNTLVIILTAYANRYKEGFIAKVFRFMTKPFTKEELYENMNACLEELNLYQIISISRHGSTKTIPVKDILYFSAYSGGSILKTAETSYFCEESLRQWEDKTSPSIFFRCNKKYLVNLNSVEQIKSHMIFLINGEKLPVSRRKWSLLKTSYIKFDITMKGATKNTNKNKLDLSSLKQNEGDTF